MATKRSVPGKASKVNPVGFAKKKSSHTFKVVFLGDSGVGKTCLAKLYLDGRVQLDSVSTVGFDYYTKEITLEDGTKVTLQVWDTAGMEQFRGALVTNYYRDTDGVVFVYDIGDRDSFVSIRDTWLRELKQYRGLENAQMALLGNKGDRVSERKVSIEEARTLAEEYGMVFGELSAAERNSYDRLTGLMSSLCTNMVGRQLEARTAVMQASHVITLGPVPISDDWQSIDAPAEPVPARLVERQDRMARNVRNRVTARTNHHC